MKEANTITADVLAQQTCDTPGCACGASESLTLHSRCHISSPTWVTYRPGVLVVTCAECDAEIVRIALPAGRN